MRHLTAVQLTSGDWVYGSEGRSGAHPVGYCDEQDHTHVSELDARMCYSRWERDNVVVRKASGWYSCSVRSPQRCRNPADNIAEVQTYMGKMAIVCDEHSTLQEVFVAMDLYRPAGDAWVS